jgi:uncharacterized protein YnzC (UPF0291/DUF896 family)
MRDIKRVHIVMKIVEEYKEIERIKNEIEKEESFEELLTREAQFTVDELRELESLSDYTFEESKHIDVLRQKYIKSARLIVQTILKSRDRIDDLRSNLYLINYSLN